MTGTTIADDAVPGGATSIMRKIVVGGVFFLGKLPPVVVTPALLQNKRKLTRIRSLSKALHSPPEPRKNPPSKRAKARKAARIKARRYDPPKMSPPKARKRRPTATPRKNAYVAKTLREKYLAHCLTAEEPLSFREWLSAKLKTATGKTRRALLRARGTTTSAGVARMRKAFAPRTKPKTASQAARVKIEWDRAESCYVGYAPGYRGLVEVGPTRPTTEAAVRAAIDNRIKAMIMRAVEKQKAKLVPMPPQHSEVK